MIPLLKTSSTMHTKKGDNGSLCITLIYNAKKPSRLLLTDIDNIVELRIVENLPNNLVKKKGLEDFENKLSVHCIKRLFNIQFDCKIAMTAFVMKHVDGFRTKKNIILNLPILNKPLCLWK